MNAPYRVIILPSAIRAARRFPRIVLGRLYKHMESLATIPFPQGVEKMEGYKHTYRMRVGDYRLVYEVASAIRIVTVIRVGHRKDIYRRL